MGALTLGPPADLVGGLRTLFELNTFVETGTNLGDTAEWASKLFDRVHTIEAASHIYEAAERRFTSHNNVTCHNGDTGAVLHSLLPTLNPAVFFLDAHWSGGSTAGAKSECPLLSELALIMPWFRKHVILIDDARLFLRPPPLPHNFLEWPSLDQIHAEARGAAYVFEYKDNIVLVPAAYRERTGRMVQMLIAQEA